MSHHVEPDACATQLDLAKAYIDMGDPDGCRELLAAVIAGGTAAQQQEARDLLRNVCNTVMAADVMPRTIEIKASHSSAEPTTRQCQLFIDEPNT